jgi:hypothetical protein
VHASFIDEGSRLIGVTEAPFAAANGMMGAIPETY